MMPPRLSTWPWWTCFTRATPATATRPGAGSGTFERRPLAKQFELTTKSFTGLRTSISPSRETLNRSKSLKQLNRWTLTRTGFWHNTYVVYATNVPVLENPLIYRLHFQTAVHVSCQDAVFRNVSYLCTSRLWYCWQSIAITGINHPSPEHALIKLF